MVGPVMGGRGAMKRLLMVVGLVVGLGVGVEAQGPGGMPARAERVSKVTSMDLQRRDKNKARRGRILALGGKAAVFYEDRVEFFTLTPEISSAPRGFIVSGSLVDPKTVRPDAILWLRNRYTLLSYNSSSNALVCSDIAVSPAGSLGEQGFCGVISVAGEILVRFPVIQRYPGTILRPLGLSMDGTYAEVWVGHMEDGDEGPGPTAPREVIAWRFPNQIIRSPGPWKSGKPKDPVAAFESLRTGFKLRKESN